MKRLAPFAVVLCAALLAVPGARAATQAQLDVHHFGVIGHSLAHGAGEAQLEQAIAANSDPALDFVVATGIKNEGEPCTDELYEQRRALFEQAKRPLIVSLAASDWSGCKNSAGRPVAIERLNRLREVLFAEQSALGKRSLPLVRLSASSQFRSYAENAHWIVGKVLYATVNVPANNNHYRPEAGRNSEFEDRAVANRFWLTRLFTLAKRKKLAAVVLFTEGDVKALSQKTGLMALLGRGDSRQDGFAPVRRQVNALAQKFDGKVLMIDSALPVEGAPGIEWRDNLGHLSVGTGVVHVVVKPASATMFSVEKP